MKTIAVLVLACLCALQAVAVEVLIPKGALPVERFAAEELSWHLKKAGIETAIVTSVSGSGQVIRLGRAAGIDTSKLSPNGARVIKGASSIEIAGRDGAGDALDTRVESGTLFGVYEFLERELGVRWLWPGETGCVIPPREQLAVKQGEYETVPPMTFSVWRIPRSVDGWSSRESAMSFRKAERIWLRRHRFNTLENCGYGHAFTNFMAKYHHDTPEIFNLLPDGTRRSDPLYFNGNPSLVSMCVSSPALAKLIVGEWAKRPKRGLINLNENDTAGKCVCPACLALDLNPDEARTERARQRFLKGDAQWYRELGSLSERYAAFYLGVQREADKIDPACRLIGDIYANYYEPPVGHKLNERIIMRFCPPIMYPWTPQKVANFKRLWQGWADSGATLMMRPNFTLDGHNMPLLYYREFAECFDFARDRGLRYSDFDSLTGMFGANGLTLYVIAARNGGGKYKPLAELENDYFAAFGKAETAMREYVSLMASASSRGVDEKTNSIEGGNYADFLLGADRIFTPDVMKRAMGILARAEQAALKEPLALARVRIVKAGLEDANLVLETQRGYREYRKSGDFRKFAANLRRLMEFRKQNEHLGYADIGVCVSLENRHWPLHLASLGDDSHELKEWRFRFDPEDEGGRRRWFATPEGEWVPFETNLHWEKTDLYKRHLASGGKARVIGWYSNRFTIGALNPKQKASICFGAVDGDADVYLNGERLLRREYPDRGDVDSWKKPFKVDVTGKLKSGENLLVVRVFKKEQFGGASGIWRPVFISFGEVETADVPCERWRTNFQQGSFSARSSSYPLKLVCSAPAEVREGAYRGVWGRLYCTEKVSKGMKYEVRIRFRKRGNARFEAWLRSGKGGLGEANINLPASTPDGAEGILVGRLKAGSEKCVIYLNLLKDVGEVEILSVKFYPVSEF